MSENAYKVEPDALDIASTDIANAQRRIEGHQLSLNSSTAHLLTQWTGAASQAWGRTQTGWQGDLAGAMAAAAALSTAVRDAAEAYRNADDAVARAWSI